MPPEPRQTAPLPRLTTWERFADLPMTILAVVFVVAYAIPIIFPGIPETAERVLHYVDLGVWALFTLDYLRRLIRAKEKFKYIRTHLLDLAVVILPPARPLRLVRSATLLVSTIDRRTRTSPRRKLAIVVGASAVVVLFMGALAILDAERGTESSIQNFGDAMWWSIVTVSTVGYGDFFPVTVEGRLVAIVLMFGGVGLLGFITASVTSWIIETLTREDKSTAQAREGVDLVLEKVRQLRAEIAELRAAAPQSAKPHPPE